MMEDSCSHINMEFADPTPSPVTIFLAAVYDRIKCSRGKLHIDCEETKGRNPHFFKNLFFW